VADTWWKPEETIARERRRAEREGGKGEWNGVPVATQKDTHKRATPVSSTTGNARSAPLFPTRHSKQANCDSITRSWSAWSGPGLRAASAYGLGSGIGRAPAATMKGRPKPADTSLSPEPGEYKLEGHMGREGPKFTLRPKTNVPADLAGTPGPGSYEHDTHKGKGPKITMAPKLNLAGLTDANPGPGAYSSPFEVGKEAPKYSMPGRGNTTSALHKSPGPGAYHSEPSGRNKIAASMKSRHYDKPDHDIPGPGAYNAEAGLTIGSSAPGLRVPGPALMLLRSRRSSVSGPGQNTSSEDERTGGGGVGRAVSRPSWTEQERMQRDSVNEALGMARDRRAGARENED
jgi:hypothetical protein